uniref:NADH dehydrogenase I subunit J n=1 Tax=uncultured prokaryote TaxID=198431 RepID=H5SP80_9ZZZZ|nr:NADH dehydrogenase I subunit J [uncultured prokaryote]
MGGILFWIFATLATAASLFVILSRNPVNSAIGLIFCFFTTACLYVLLDAQFVAAIQVLVYAGAIMVLFLFAIMLLNIEKDIKREVTSPVTRFFGITFGLGILTEVMLLLWYYRETPFMGPYTPERLSLMGNIQAIGRSIFVDYMLPFEILSILLIIGIIGAVVLAKRD